MTGSARSGASRGVRATGTFRRSTRARLLAVVPLLALAVLISTLVAGQRSASDPAGSASAGTAATADVTGTHDGHGASGATPGDGATASADARAGDDVGDASVSPVEPVGGASDGVPSAGDAAGAATGTPPGSVPVPDPVSPPSGSALGASTGTSLTEAAGRAPAVRAGADGLGEPRAPVDPADVLTSAASLGGCHPAYGEDGQCLPLIPPSMAAHAAEMIAAGLDPASMPHPWTCDELLQAFPDGIAVRAVPAPGVSDPLDLDPDGDLIACATA